MYHIYPKYLDISTPYHTYSKIWTNTIYCPMMCLKIAGWVANSVDPDETPHSAASHLGLNCLFRAVCLKTYENTVTGFTPNIQSHAWVNSLDYNHTVPNGAISLFVGLHSTVSRASDYRSKARMFESQLSHITIIEIDREFISTVILPLLLIQKG